MLLRLIFFVLPFVLSGYQYDMNLNLTHIRINDKEFLDNTGTAQAIKFENEPIGKKYFEDDSKISIDYEYFSTSEVSNLEFSVLYNGDELDKSTVNNSSLSFKLKDLFDEIPLSNNGSFKIEFKMSYNIPTLTDKQTKTIEIEFFYDTVPPGKIENLKAVSGNENIKITWEYPDNVNEKEVDRVFIYYKDKEVDENYSEIEAAGLSTEYRIKDLRNEHTYSIYLKVYDIAGNESEKSDEIEAKPLPVEDFYKYYRKAGGKEDGGYCFIATAAYGSYDNGMVKILRVFRDKYLSQNIIKTYYKYSPPLANLIAKSKILSFTVRILLEPFVIYVIFLMYGALWFKFMMLFLLILLFVIRINPIVFYFGGKIAKSNK